MKRGLRARKHFIFAVLIIFVTLELSTFQIPSIAAIKQNSFPHAFAKTAPYASTSKSVSILLISANSSALYPLSWSLLQPSPTTTKNWVYAYHHRIYLPIDKGQISQYQIIGNVIYWVVEPKIKSNKTHSATPEDQLYYTVLNTKERTSKIKVPASSMLLFTAPSTGIKPASAIHLWHAGTALFFSLNSEHTGSEVYQILNDRGVKRIQGTFNANNPFLYAISWRGNSLLVQDTYSKSGNAKLAASFSSGVEQTLHLPYWPVNVVAIGQYLYLTSGPDMYKISATGNLQKTPWVSPEIIKTFAPIFQQFANKYIVVPSLYLLQSKVHNYFATVKLLNHHAYELSLTPQGATQNYHAKISNTTDNISELDYANWIKTIRSLISSAQGRMYTSNTNISSQYPLPKFFGSQPVIHQFILGSLKNPWILWSQIGKSKTGSDNWFATWGAHHWLYTAGPLPGPANSSTMFYLRQLINASKQYSMQPYAESGKVNIKVAWQNDIATFASSEYEFNPAPHLSVKITANGYSGWKDLENFTTLPKTN